MEDNSSDNSSEIFMYFNFSAMIICVSTSDRDPNPDKPETTNCKHQISNKFQITISNLKKD